MNLVGIIALAVFIFLLGFVCGKQIQWEKGIRELIDLQQEFERMKRMAMEIVRKELDSEHEARMAEYRTVRQRARHRQKRPVR